LDHFLLGAEHHRQGRWPRALASFETALQRQPDHFWSQYHLALIYLKTHRWDLAATGFSACLGRQPDFAWLYLLRGAARGELGQFRQAEADFVDAEKHSLDAAARYGLHINRGVLRVRQKHWPEAIADFRRAIDLKPQQYQG